MGKPLVSVITPSYNCSEFIAQAISTVLDQTMTDWEMLITDDCSTDDSVAVISKFAQKDERVKVFSLEKNSGAGVARNNSIEKAQGRYIAFLDGDDYWRCDKLEKQLEFMEHKGATVSYTSYMTVNEAGETTGIVVSPSTQTAAQNHHDNKMGFSTVIYDTEALGKVMMPVLRKRQDWGLTMKLLGRDGIAFGMKEPLTYYRKGQNSLSKNKSSLIKYNVAVYREILGWSVLKSYLYFIFVFAPSYFFKLLCLKFMNR